MVLSWIGVNGINWVDAQGWSPCLSWCQVGACSNFITLFKNPGLQYCVTYAFKLTYCIPIANIVLCSTNPIMPSFVILSLILHFMCNLRSTLCTHLAVYTIVQRKKAPKMVHQLGHVPQSIASGQNLQGLLLLFSPCFLLLISYQAYGPYDMPLVSSQLWIMFLFYNLKLLPVMLFLQRVGIAPERPMGMFSSYGPMQQFERACATIFFNFCNKQGSIKK